MGGKWGEIPWFNARKAGEVFARLAGTIQKNQSLNAGMTIEGLGKVKVDEQPYIHPGNTTEGPDNINWPKLVKLGL